MKAKFSFIIFLLSLSIAVIAQGVFIPISKETTNIKGKQYFVHKIEQGQTMYSICKTYKVTVDDIIRTSEKTAIQIGEIIYILAVDGISNTQIATSAVIDTTHIAIVTAGDSIQKTTPNATTSALITSGQKHDTIPAHALKEYSDELTIAFLLPLYLSRIATANPESDDNTTDKIFSYSSFFQGVMLASQINKTTNANINIRFFDVYDEKTAEKLIASKQLEDVNLIVGPIFLKPFNLVNEYANSHDVYIVNPLSEKTEIIDQQPLSIKLSTSEHDIINNVIQHIISTKQNQKLIIIGEDSNKCSAIVAQFIDTLQSSMDTVICYNFVKQKLSGIEKIIRHDSVVLLYIADNEAILSSLITTLSKVNTNNHLYCLRNYDLLIQTEVEYLDKVNFKYAENYFTDRTNPKVAYFEKLFYEQFDILPDKNAYIAFDLTNHFIRLLSDKNVNFGLYLSTFESEGLANDYLFMKKTDSGFANVKSRIVSVVDSQLVNLK